MACGACGACGEDGADAVLVEIDGEEDLAEARGALDMAGTEVLLEVSIGEEAQLAQEGAEVAELEDLCDDWWFLWFWWFWW